jgi:hypothetical protein
LALMAMAMTAASAENPAAPFVEACMSAAPNFEQTDAAAKKLGLRSTEGVELGGLLSFITKDRPDRVFTLEDKRLPIIGVTQGKLLGSAARSCWMAGGLSTAADYERALAPVIRGASPKAIVQPNDGSGGLPPILNSLFRAWFVPCGAERCMLIIGGDPDAQLQLGKPLFGIHFATLVSGRGLEHFNTERDFGALPLRRPEQGIAS